MDFTTHDGTATDAGRFDQNFNDIFSQTTTAIETSLTNQQPDKALESLTLFVSTANLYVQIKTSIINKLSSIIGQLKTLLQKIAKQINAASYSISVTAPIGISVSVTWNV